MRQQRSHDAATTQRDSGEAARTGAAKESMEHRLGLIGTGVTGGDPLGADTLGRGAKRPVPSLAGCQLDVLARRDHDTGALKWNVERVAERRAELPIRRAARAQLMIDVTG